MSNESTVQEEELVKKNSILLSAVVLDDIMISIIDNAPKNLDTLSTKQREMLRMRCIYLQKAYEIVL